MAASAASIGGISQGIDQSVGSGSRGLHLSPARPRVGSNPMRRLLVLVLLAFAFAGCGTSGDSKTTEAKTTTAPPVTEPVAPTETTKPKPKPTGRSKFTGQDRENYDTAKQVCGAFPPAKVAADLGLDRNRGRTAVELGDIAQAYAKEYRGSFQRAAFEGCLAGLPDARG